MSDQEFIDNYISMTDVENWLRSQYDADPQWVEKDISFERYLAPKALIVLADLLNNSYSGDDARKQFAAWRIEQRKEVR